MPRTRIKTNDIMNAKVTSAKLENDVTIAGALIVTGNLTVNGTTTTINTSELAVEDTVITLNSGYVGTADLTPDSGIEIERGVGVNSYILWRESSDTWELSHPLKITVNSGVTILDITQSSDEVKIWDIHEPDSFYGFDLRYIGSGSGDDNALELWADNQEGTGQKVYRVQQSGIMAFSRPVTFNDNITMAVDKTVDGVDISAHHANSIVNVKHVSDDVLAALAGTSGTAPSSTNKFVDNSDTRLTNTRTPIIHGDDKHNALSYFSTFSDGSNSRSASSSNQSVRLESAGATTITVGDHTGYAANVKISSVNNYVSGTSFANEIITYTRSGLSDITTDLSNTWLKLSSASEQTVDGNIKITGNLTIQGTTTTINTTNLAVSDNIVILNNDVTGTPTENAGIEVERGTSSNVSILWNESSDRWTLTEDGSNYKRIVTDNHTGLVRIKSGIAGLQRVMAFDIPNTDAGVGTYLQFMSSTTDGYGPIIGGLRTGSGATGDLFISTGGGSPQERIRVLDNGNVGIGTSSPQELLHINGSVRGNQSGALRISTGNGYIDIGPKTASFAHFYTDRPGYYFDKKIFTEEGTFGSYGAIDLSLNTNASSTKVTIKNDTGRVGIGTTTPGEMLTVVGKAKTTEGYIVGHTDGSNKFEIKYDAATQCLSFSYIGV